VPITLINFNGRIDRFW